MSSRHCGALPMATPVRTGTRLWAAARLLALLSCAPAAWAQYLAEPQFLPAPRGYLSLAGGSSSYGVSCNHSAQCDRVGTTVRGAAGVFVTPFAAIELAVADFGDSRVGSPQGDSELNVRMAGLGLALTVDYRARFNGLLRFGVAQVQADRQPLWDTGLPAWRSTTAEVYYGLTLGYMLNSVLAAELSLDGTRFEDAFEGLGRVDALTLGLSLRF